MFSLRGLDVKLDKIIKDTILEYSKKIFDEAMGNAPLDIKSSFSFEVLDNGYRCYIYTDNEMAAYIEFGTGNYAKSYLSGKPAEMKADAIQFYKNGKGRLPETPYLFPAFYKYRDKIIPEIDRRIQKLFDSL